MARLSAIEPANFSPAEVVASARAGGALPRPCSRCGAEPRAGSSGWGKRCIAERMREIRRARRSVVNRCPAGTPGTFNRERYDSRMALWKAAKALWKAANIPQEIKLRKNSDEMRAIDTLF